MIFSIDFNRLIVLLLPMPLRTEVQIAWLQSLVKPIVQVYDWFMAYRAQSFVELSYNGQTIMMEKCLNDKLDSSLRRIVVTNIPFVAEPTYFPRRGEGDPIYIARRGEGFSPLYLPTRAEYLSQATLLIEVPASLEPQELLLRALVKRLLVATVFYEINYI